ncbi:MAG: 1-deoxy-D-xylulose-5-phosphate reductoisomerase, partial [Mucinivorans sp.]
GAKFFDPFAIGNLSFIEPDMERYPCLRLAYDCLNLGGVMPCALNAAGEVAVEAFLNKRISYTDIFVTIDRAMQQIVNQPIQTIETLYSVDDAVRRVTSKLIS